MTINFWFSDECKSHSQAITKQDLQEMKEEIMSAISEFATRVNARFDELDAASDVLNTAVAGVGSDVQFLKDKITQIQNSPGPLSPEDQTALNDAEARLNGMVSRQTQLAAAAKAIDEATDSAPSPVPST